MIKALQCTLVKHFDFPVAMTLADYYAENSLKFRYDVAPVILNTQENLNYLRDLGKAVEDM